ncbi:MAG: CsbD family protein [Armatimonadetes bacterium]|nr:CsbD family protein [Armatimonadota bacterium]
MKTWLKRKPFKARYEQGAEIHKDEVKGKIKEEIGEAQEGFGRLVNSPKHVAEGQEKQIEGEFDQVKGKIKKAIHKAID